MKRLTLALAVLATGCATETTLHIEADTAWRAEIAGRSESGRTSRTFEIEPDDCATVYVLGSGWCRAYVLRRTPGLVPDHEWSEHVGGSRGDTLRVCGGDIE